jgi:hypothetical protein
MCTHLSQNVKITFLKSLWALSAFHAVLVCGGMIVNRTCTARPSRILMNHGKKSVKCLRERSSRLLHKTPALFSDIGEDDILNELNIDFECG